MHIPAIRCNMGKTIIETKNEIGIHVGVASSAALEPIAQEARERLERVAESLRG